VFVCVRACACACARACVCVCVCVCVWEVEQKGGLTKLNFGTGSNARKLELSRS